MHLWLYHCQHSKKKTTRATDIKVVRYILHDSRSAGTDPELKRSTAKVTRLSSAHTSRVCMMIQLAFLVSGVTLCQAGQKDEWREDLREEDGGCRCYRRWQKMVMWYWSEKLKTDGDGVIECHFKNLLYSRTLVENEAG